MPSSIGKTFHIYPYCDGVLKVGLIEMGSGCWLIKAQFSVLICVIHWHCVTGSDCWHQWLWLKLVFGCIVVGELGLLEWELCGSVGIRWGEKDGEGRRDIK